MTAPCPVDSTPRRDDVVDDDDDDDGKDNSRNIDESASTTTIPVRHDSKVDDASFQEQERALQQGAADQQHHVVDTRIQTDPTIASYEYPALPRQISPSSLSITTSVDMDQTNAESNSPDMVTVVETPVSTEFSSLRPPKTSPSGFPVRTSSLRSVLSTASMASSASPVSTLASPFLAGMSDLTPLPSPMVGLESSVSPQKIPGRPGTPSRSRSGSMEDATPKGRPIIQQASPTSPQRRKKPYGSLLQDAVEANAATVDSTFRAGSGHGRNRSISDFKPDQLHNVRPRHVTLGSVETHGIDGQEYQMHRETYLADQRGLTALDSDAKKQLPSPPPSTSSVVESDDADEDEQPFLEDGTASEYLEIHCGLKNKRRKFRQLRALGQGTFSTVMLATREKITAHPTPEIEEHLDPHRLVAVKIVEHGPAGGADQERIETGLRREVEMLKSVSHPCLIHLKACEYQPTRTLLVLTYCPGGDLFELASGKRDILMPHMVQRIFAELVSAVRYLHANWIVHRDIKLENVLVNLPDAALKAIDDPRTNPTPIVTLTDMGLSRRIPTPPAPPLLETRCGSEDYAAPEILLGQAYDGRQTDAWALGVLLYALMEGRLPFDAPPGRPERSRNTHRIARCDWIWCRFGDDDGDWDASRSGGVDFEGARTCVEGLLKKVRMGRWPLENIESSPWVRDGIQLPDGLQLLIGDEDDEML